MAEKDVTAWDLEEAEEECARLNGHFESRRGRILIVYEEGER